MKSALAASWIRLNRADFAWTHMLIADSCFRPLATANGLDMLGPTGLSDLLIQAYARRCRALMDEWGAREGAIV